MKSRVSHDSGIDAGCSSFHRSAENDIFGGMLRLYNGSTHSDSRGENLCFLPISARVGSWRTSRSIRRWRSAGRMMHAPTASLRLTCLWAQPARTGCINLTANPAVDLSRISP